jgi:hypothetical protein
LHRWSHLSVNNPPIDAISSLPALAVLILAVAGRLKDALRAVDIARRLRPT